MSSQTKDPVEKQDAPSESGESHSDGEVEKAEENLEHLQIEPKEEAEDDTDESKSFDFPIQERRPSSPGRDSEPAGSSGLNDPRLTHSEPAFQDLTKGFQEMLDPENHAVYPSLEDKPSSPIPSKRYFEPKKRDLPHHYHEGLASHLQTLAYKRMSFASDSANTSSDISEIRSEVVDLPTEDHEASDAVVKETSPSDDVPAVERQSSESSDKNVDMQEEDSAPLPTPSGSDASISTNTAEQGHQAYLARLQREADARGVPVSTSSGIGSTDQSELANRQRWGDVGYYRPNLEDIPDSPNKEISELGAQFGEAQPEAGCMQVEQSLEVRRKQDCGGLFQQKEESKAAENVTRKMEVEGNIETSNVEEASPSAGRKRSKRVSDSDSAESVAAKLRPRVKPDVGRKSKIAASKSGATSQSSSDSPDPKSSSSDELRRKDSPDIKSSSPSQSDRGKKSWQKFGQLRSMQLSAVASKDSVITEEEESQLSPRRALNPELIGTKETSPEKMETTPEKNVEGATGTEQTEYSLESGDQACASEAVAASKEHESSFEVSEFERSVGQTKRPGGKLSTSPPSDEKLSSTPPKEATSRPKKKARADKKHEKTTRRTRHDSGGSVPRSVSRERLQRDDSASTSTPDVSDYSGSDKDEEEETAL